MPARRAVPVVGSPSRGPLLRAVPAPGRRAVRDAMAITAPPAQSSGRPADDGGRGVPARDRVTEERALFERYLDGLDPQHRELLLERYLPHADQLARRYERSDEPFDDLFQVASLGLVKAIDRFDPERPVAFSSYAVPTIVGELKRHFRDKTWSVRVPRDLKELSLKVDSTVTELNKELGRQPSVSQIAERLELSEEEVLEA